MEKPEPNQTEQSPNDKAGGGKLWTPKQREAKPAKLTAEQYLKTASVNEGIGGLVLSMYGAKIMPFAEWDALVKSLLKRQVK